MSIAFKCTSCGRGLRANPEMVGKRTKCPGCSTVLTIPGAEVSAAAPKPAAAKTSPAATPAGAVLACETCGTKVRAKPEWAGKAIKCPNCQGRIKVPGAAAAEPSPIKAAAARKPAPPVEDEPLPDDDGAFGGEEDDAVARPARKKAAPPPPKKKSRMGLLIALLLLLLAGGGGFFAWAFYFDNPAPIAGPIQRPNVNGGGNVKDDEDDEKKSSKPILAGAGNPFDSVPSDALGFFNVKPQSLFKTATGQKLLAELDDKSPFGKVHKQLSAAFGVGLVDIVDAVLVVRAAPLPPVDPKETTLVIVSMAISIDPKGFDAEFEGKKFEKKELNDNPYYVIGPPNETLALLQTATNVIVAGDEKAIRKFIESGTPKTGPLSPLLKSASLGKHLAFVAFQLPTELADMAKKNAPATMQPFIALAEAKFGQFIINDDNGLNVFAKLSFDDAAKAEEAKKAIDGALFLAGAMLPALAKSAPPEFAKNIQGGGDAFKAIKPIVVENAVEISIPSNLTIDQVAAMIEPILMQARGAAQQTQGLNNLKQLALSMHNFHDTYRQFPDAKIGAGLSWRVAMLPFVEQANLYKAIKSDEPWDSEHNKQFLATMPKVFEHPTRKAPLGHTFYRVFVGPMTMFEEGKQTKLQTILDGTSNTLMIVEAADAVPWTKPDELVFDPTGALPKLGDPAHGGAFSAAFADGSVRVFQAIDEATLRALITASGGELVDLGKLK